MNSKMKIDLILYFQSNIDFFIITVGLLPRFYSYQSFFDTQLDIYVVNYEKVEYVQNFSNTGLIVDSSKYQPQQCWVKKMCTLSDKEIIKGKLVSTCFLPRWFKTLVVF